MFGHQSRQFAVANKSFPVRTLLDRSLEKAMNLVQGLRGLAYNVTSDPDFQEYLWTVLLSGLNLAAALSRNNPARSQALVYCSVICHRLDHWDEPWPPENWPNLLESS